MKQKADAAMIGLEGAARNAALVAQMEEIGAHLLLAEFIIRNDRPSLQHPHFGALTVHSSKLRKVIVYLRISGRSSIWHCNYVRLAPINASAMRISGKTAISFTNLSSPVYGYH